MRVLLVGNYPFDGSTSMQVWAHALERELSALGIEVRLVAPQPVFGRLKSSPDGAGKWLGYIDRYLLFPRALKAAAADADVVHMCDHGSAIYCPLLKGKPTVVTCNDMLAVRGAIGELPELRPSWFGRYLQRWICSGLGHATRVACISRATFDDASRILGRHNHLRVVLDALNYPFQVLSPEETERRLVKVTELRKPFVLHVGSGHARKNRDGILRIFAQVAAKVDMQLVFAGHAMNQELDRLARRLGVRDRVVQVVKPDVTVIEALYNRACALLFPSRFEGFGWPPIEAQACGCPVVASDIPPIAEVLRDTAALHRIDDETGMAESILRLAVDEDHRNRMRQMGFENVRSRFQTARMMEEYVALYQEIATHHNAPQPV